MSTGPYSVVRVSGSTSVSLRSRQQAQGGQVVPLPPLGAAGDQSTQGAGWFGPLRPMDAVAPPQVSGRRWDFPSGINQRISPRVGEAISFYELRILADSYDLLRTVIEKQKNQMARLRWAFVPRDEKQKLKDGSPLQARAKKYELMFRRPDRENFWPTWLKTVLEDLLVIDAPAIHIRRTLDGEDVYSLDPIDGATIKRVVDDWGRTPEPPFAAYQQILKGLPAVNYSRADLLYRPRNIRTNKLYGFSPVEQLVMSVNIALRRQMWQLAYFTDGNLPDSLIGVPSTWTPDQIRQFQDWFDGLLMGNTAGRRSARFVPGEVAKSYVPTKEAEIFGAAEEWLARLVCFCFGVSHQALVKEVNRATADNAYQQAVEDGLSPIMTWVKELVDSILMDEFEEEDLEFSWVNDKELDPVKQSEIIKQQVDSALITRNEGREILGKEPSNDPEADVLAVTTPNGPVPLSVEKQIEQKQKMQDAFPPPPPVAGQVGAPKGSAGGGPAGGEGAGAGGRSPPPKATAPAPGGKKSAKLEHAHAEPVVKSAADDYPVSATRPLAQKARARMARKVAAALSRTEASVVRQVRSALDKLVGKVAKGDPTHGDGVENDARMTTIVTSADVRRITDGLDLSDLLTLREEVEPDLEKVAVDAGRQALAMVGVEKRSELVDQVSELAVERARQTAAELVGKRVLGDGSVIDNPSPEWAITDSTREMIHDLITRVLADNLGSDAIIDALETDFAFSPARAEMVSRTEVANINSESSMDGYRTARDAGVEVKKEWILGPNPCEICEGNADDGPIDLDEEFSSGDTEPGAHPNCECAVVPVVAEEQ